MPPPARGLTLLLLFHGSLLTAGSLCADGMQYHPRNKRQVASRAVEVEVALELLSAGPPDVTGLRSLVNTFNFFKSTLNLTDTKMSTVCTAMASGALRCQCENQLLWSCDQCSTYERCDTTTAGTCSCIDALPPDGQLCQAITNLTTCPTPPPLTSTTTQTTTTTTPNTSTTPSPSPLTTTPDAAVVERNFNLSMDIEFQEAFNDPTHPLFREIEDSVVKNSQASIAGFVSAKLNRLLRGSVIAEYNIQATGLSSSEISVTQQGILSDLGEKFNIITPSTTPLTFTPAEAFVRETLTVSCGPPPDQLNFSDSLTVEWSVNGAAISSRHSTSIDNQRAQLQVTPLLTTDSGTYQCLLKDKTVFQQTGVFTVREVPSFQVSPIRANIPCQDGEQTQVPVTCCAATPFIPQLRDGNQILAQGSGSGCFTHNYQTICGNRQVLLTCEERDNPQFKEEITLVLSTDTFTCFEDPVFGNGRLGDKGVAPCENDEIGQKTAVCRTDGEWGDRRNTCVLKVIDELLFQSQFLDEFSLPGFLQELSNVTINSTAQVVESPANIGAVVRILVEIANTSQSTPINRFLMTDILVTVNVIIADEARASWETLNANTTTNSVSTVRTGILEARTDSSALLAAIETVSDALTNDSFEITTRLIILNKTTFTDFFNADLNSSVVLEISVSDQSVSDITTITFESLDNVLPPTNANNDSSNVINGNVVLVKANTTVSSASFTFDVFNETLGNPECVFWNFSLLGGLGAWDDQGCELVGQVDNRVTCICNHLTSFSILMSPFVPNIPNLDKITYAGVAISMACLVICLLIEGIIWTKVNKNSTSYLRHVCIVNIALSLLIADIWFIIGAAIADDQSLNLPACRTATFFIHLFYLAMFFWMLVSAMLLLYRTVSVFATSLSDGAMLAIGFSIGYGTSVIITTITIAVTAPQGVYIRRTEACWLNWFESKALLAFVIPALLIVLINLLILLLVLYKMLRSRSLGESSQPGQRHTLLVIVRSLAVLTPFFGTTWALGVGTMTNPREKGIHIAFAFFNSLQGLFILVFGTILDRKVRSELAAYSRSQGSKTKSTSAGTRSSRLGFLRSWGRARDVFNVSSAAPTSTSAPSDSFYTNT